MEELSNVSYANVQWLFLLPAIWIGFDIITGWIQASINGTWDSTKMRKGLYRKGGELLIVVIAFLTQQAIPVLQEIHIARFMSLYIVLMETLSVIENLDQAGVAIPKFLHERLKKIKDRVDTGEGNGN